LPDVQIPLQFGEHDVIGCGHADIGFHSPSYDVVNHSTNSASKMAVKRRMIQGKFLSMFSKVVMGRSPDKRQEDASGDVEDQDH
jgi:hypothetical protein